MKTIAILLILATLLVWLAVKAEENGRAKRALAILEFARMIRCTTGRSAFLYNGYGRWCGLGGSGTPVDATDWCCRDHDYCYRNLVSSKTCTKFRLRFTSYKRDPNGACTSCSSSNSGCGAGLCRCDQIAANCFKTASFNRKYVNYKSKNSGK
ncbi:neutral phospholipase A2 agkistrodotoxin-like [Paramuricea clavata]|uniref:Phospholipase A2 n=1 Tax=Paramuricea clavata TaxID=317549 RepID=A0A6S7HTB2_PARCT|nr:neutral phospholipase A2 agkistrodotoxin-like [Paramuricea clavata]